MTPLFHDLAKVLDTVCQPIARALRQYALHSHCLATCMAISPFIWRRYGSWSASATAACLCRPEIAPMTERVCALQEAYNLNLALQLMETPRSKTPWSLTMSPWGKMAGSVF